MIVKSKYRRSIIGLMACLLLLSMWIALLFGPIDISLSTIAKIIINQLGFGLETLWFETPWFETQWRPWVESVVIDVRLPRILVAALVGGCLAVSGATMQGMFRNPLASPTVLGVSSGASLGAVLAIYLGLSASFIWVLPLFAFFGAAITLFLVYSIASTQGQTPIGTLLLAGVAIGALNVAMSSFITALSFKNFEVSRMIVYWTMGGLEGRVWDHVWLMLPIAGIGSAILFSYVRDLDVLMLGDIHATAVGIDPQKVRIVLLVVTAIMVGGAISVAGGIGFIGLVVPHVMRLLIGPSHLYLLPASFLGGSLCLVGADLILRSYFSDSVIPLGVLTAMVGAPFFLFLLMKRKREYQL